MTVLKLQPKDDKFAQKLIDSADKKEVLDGLKNAAGYVRHILAEQLDMRKTPEIAFYYDESIEKAKRIEELLEQIK